MMTMPSYIAMPPALPLGNFDYEAAFDAADGEIIQLLGVGAAPYVQLCFDDICYAVAQKNWVWVASLMHTLKCMAAYFGAQPVTALATQIERICKDGDGATVGDEVAQLTQEMDKFLPVLRRRMLEDPRLQGGLSTRQ